MPTVVAVKLRYNPKALWFDPVESVLIAGDHVIIETERGREIGLVVESPFEVSEKQIKDLNTPLKPVIRTVTENDFDRIDQLDAKGRAAMPVFRSLVNKHELDMKPVEVEYLFSGDKAVFYFSSEERVDFRDLVRELASQFHVRIDMRQIGVRDEARMLGGLAHCGEELCCARMGGDFQPVSIRMAKEQDLPLNPVKISGACGRLMCCLRYEFEAYKDFKSRAPKKGAIIETPLGKAKVTDFNTPREIVNMRLEDGKFLSIPLKAMECEKEGQGCCSSRPCKIGRSTLDEYASGSIIIALAALDREFEVEDLTDAQATPVARPVRRGDKPAHNKGKGERRSGSSRKRRKGGGADRTADGASDTDRATRDRGAVADTTGTKSTARPRPGQNSSGVRNKGQHSERVVTRDNTRKNTRNAKGNPTRDTKGAGPRDAGKNTLSDASHTNERSASQGDTRDARKGTSGEGRRRRRRSSTGGGSKGGSNKESSKNTGGDSA